MFVNVTPWKLFIINKRISESGAPLGLFQWYNSPSWNRSFLFFFFFLSNNEGLGTIWNPVIELSPTTALKGRHELKDILDFKSFLKSAAADKVLPFSFTFYPENAVFKQQTLWIQANTKYIGLKHRIKQETTGIVWIQVIDLICQVIFACNTLILKLG